MNLSSFVGRWSFVLFGVGLGLVFAVADLAQGVPPIHALIAFAVVAGYGLALTLLRSRSETASALAGRPVDERWQDASLRAVAASGMVGAIVALGGFVIAEATGHDGMEFAIVAGAVGLAYIISVVWFRVRG